MPLQAIMPQFSRGITTAMSNAQQSVQSIGDMASKYLADEENKRRYEKDYALRVKAEDRAQSAENRAQSEFDRLNKERENVITATSVLADLQPHLQSQLQSAVPEGMEGVMKQGIMPTGGGYASGGAVSQVVGTELKPYKYREEIKQSNTPVDTKFKYNVNTTPYKEGPMNSVRMHKLEPLQKELDSLLDTKGMYATRPASSVRDLSPEGIARRDQLQSQIREVMRDKSVPKTTNTLMSSFGSLDLGTALTKDGKPAGKNTPFDQQYVMDKANNKLVSMSTATAVAQKQQQGIDMASVPQYVEKTGYKEVPIKSDRIMAKFTAKGYAPAEVQSAMGNVQSQYMKLMEMLPKDNSARREEYKQYANMIVGNLGVDPRSFDVNAYVDKIMPETKMSDAQKTAFNTAVHAVDAKLDQFNKDRTFNLQKWEAEASMAIRNAELSLRKAESTPKMDPITQALAIYQGKKGIDLEFEKKSPVAQAERQMKIDEALLKRKQTEQENYKAYLEDVSGVTDAYDYQQWLKAGKPMHSSAGFGLGTWGGR